MISPNMTKTHFNTYIAIHHAFLQNAWHLKDQVVNKLTLRDSLMGMLVSTVY